MTGSDTRPTWIQRVLRWASCLPIPRRRGLYARLASYRDDRPREFDIDFFGVRYRGTLAQYVDRQIYYFGAYSFNELSFLRRAAEILKKTRDVVTFVDVGANVGQHSLFMSRKVDHVVAFEPNDEVADRLQANVDYNGLQNVTLIRAAVGQEHGEGQLGSGLDRNSGSRSLVWSLDESLNTKVEIVRGDDALARAGVVRVDILKVDVEGYEKNVFAGLRPVLDRDRPVILFELVGTDVKGGFRSEQELRSALYRDAELFSLDSGDLPRLLPFEWQREEAVCLPKELAGLFNLDR